MWQTIRATIIRNQIANMRAYPWSFTFGHILSGLFIALTSFFAYHYFIQKQLDQQFIVYTGTNDYLTFAIIGGLLNSMSVSVMMNVSRALITEWREGTLEALLLSPSHRTGYLIGTGIQQLYRVILELVPVILIGLWIGMKVPDAHWGSSIIAILLFLFACFSIALVLGAIMLRTRDTYIVQNTLFSILVLICGFQFPTQYLPQPLQGFGEIFPLKGALHLLRDSLMTGTPIWEHPQETLLTCMLSMIFMIVGLISIKRVERTIFERHMA
ncbi:ABC transporter permease [Paenibacillus sp. KN14-4R]|uniref:ABC transporter permease n=1 Tax=Paenibacillus sp. KN14-4R TaxID=3445773 RepID=UPI003FA09451